MNLQRIEQENEVRVERRIGADVKVVLHPVREGARSKENNHSPASHNFSQKFYIRGDG